jgi:anti-anti-sigma regulatory factor
MRRRHFMLAPAAARFISQPRQLGPATAAAPGVPGTGRRGRAAGLGRAVLFAALAARGAGPDAGPQILRLTPPGPLDDGRGQAFIDAVRGRALAGRPPGAAVVLDLSAAQALDGSWCAVLVALNDSLRPSGTRLRLAGVPARLLPGLEEAGVCQHIGADAIHSSVRSALLAIHAAAPGPGLVTAPVRASLARCADDAGIPAD